MYIRNIAIHRYVGPRLILKLGTGFNMVQQLNSTSSPWPWRRPVSLAARGSSGSRGSRRPGWTNAPDLGLKWAWRDGLRGLKPGMISAAPWWGFVFFETAWNGCKWFEVSQLSIWTSEFQSGIPKVSHWARNSPGLGQQLVHSVYTSYLEDIDVVPEFAELVHVHSGKCLLLVSNHPYVNIVPLVWLASETSHGR